VEKRDRVGEVEEGRYYRGGWCLEP
jgi:hypothetical protein